MRTFHRHAIAVADRLRVPRSASEADTHAANAAFNTLRVFSDMRIAELFLQSSS
jgi:hypothetical protein